nr:transposase [Streptomyces colonosanans]
MRELIAEREWLTVFLLPAHSPDLNPVEWVWVHVRRSLANLAVVALDRLEPSYATGSIDFSTGPTPLPGSWRAPA